VQASRLASFELLTESVALTGPEKFLRKATCVSVFFSQKSPKVARCQSVKTIDVYKQSMQLKHLFVLELHQQVLQLQFVLGS